MRTVDLFAGAGLLTEGFRRAGFRCAFAAEADARAVASFNTNLEPVAEVWDVHNVKTIAGVDVLVAGPPCQGFSSLGKRETHDERNGLSLLVLDWMKAINPAVVVIENVPQFLLSSYWLRIKRAAKRMGYQSTGWKLNSADFGAPQIRWRAFGILSRIGLPEAPVPCVQEYMTVRQAFYGLSRKTSLDSQHIAPVPSGVALERISLIPEKGDKRDLMKVAPHLCPPSWFKLGQQATDVWGRIDFDRPSNTLRCSFQNPSKGRYLHPIEDRVISLREGARLQGIPDRWTFSGDRTSIARQIGNGVPVQLAVAVAGSIGSLFDCSIREKDSKHITH